MSLLLVRDFEELTELKLEVIRLNRGHAKNSTHNALSCDVCLHVYEIKQTLSRHRFERAKWLKQCRVQDRKELGIPLKRCKK